MVCGGFVGGLGWFKSNLLGYSSSFTMSDHSNRCSPLSWLSWLSQENCFSCYPPGAPHVHRRQVAQQRTGRCVSPGGGVVFREDGLRKGERRKTQRQPLEPKKTVQTKRFTPKKRYNSKFQVRKLYKTRTKKKMSRQTRNKIAKKK